MRERNRIAQRRYRNRQRFRLQESEQKLVELTERVRVLTSEKVREAAAPVLLIYNPALGTKGSGAQH